MGLLVGIDPGVNTGVAIWDTNKRAFRTIETTSIVRAMRMVAGFVNAAKLVQTNPYPELYIEDARKRKWIPREQNLSQFKGRAMGAGSVRRDCEIWEEFCIEYDIPYTAVPPRKGATKWDADYFKKVTGWTGRTSNHARDAALLVFGK